MSPTMPGHDPPLRTSSSTSSPKIFGAMISTNMRMAHPRRRGRFLSSLDTSQCAGIPEPAKTQFTFLQHRPEVGLIRGSSAFGRSIDLFDDNDVFGVKFVHKERRMSRYKSL